MSKEIGEVFQDILSDNEDFLDVLDHVGQKASEIMLTTFISGIIKNF